MTDIYIHPTAVVDTAVIGDGTRIWAFTHVLSGVSIGAYCNIGDHCFIETGAVIGNYVTIKNGNQLWEGITLADGVFIGPNVSFTNDRRPRSPRLPQVAARYVGKEWLSPTLVKKGASVGAGAIVLAGNTIGESAMVGAGAIVTRDVPAYALVIGSPARIAGWVCECGFGLEFSAGTAVCRECGVQFIQKDHHVAIMQPRAA
jgi:acetyltransferase-like isoleucine patch superfamily enzyme